MTFPKNKTIKELGIDTTREFIVVEPNGKFDKGDILTFDRDDNSSSPMFKKKAIMKVGMSISIA